MGDLAIRIDNLSKAFKIKNRQSHLSDLLSAPWSHRKAKKEKGSSSELFWALENVSLDIEKGEVVGIVGRNGSGKSTLLKVISRITSPTKGVVELYGRVAALLEVGTGFHPELSGRENIYLNGSILGMKRSEIQASFAEIVEFSGLERFLDQPIKRYSTGMFLRLAFAVAAHLRPEIILVDEVLAVGDQEFQNKCLNKMDGVSKEGRTVLLVSHQLQAIRKLCTRTIWINQGRLVMSGNTNDVLAAYEMSVANAHDDREQFSPDVPRFINWHIVDGANSSQSNLNQLNSAGPFCLEFGLEVPTRLENVVIQLFLYTESDQLIWGGRQQSLSLEPGVHQIHFFMPYLPLVPGVYTWAISVLDWYHDNVIEAWRANPPMVITSEFQDGQTVGFLNIPFKFESHRKDDLSGDG